MFATVIAQSWFENGGRWWLGLVILILPTYARSTYAQTFDVVEAKAQWEKARSIAPSISGTSHDKSVYIVRPDPKLPDLDYLREVKQNKGCVSTHLKSSDLIRLKNAEFVLAVNPKYAFQIKRTIGSKDWVLDQIDMGSDGSQLTLANGLPQRDFVQMWVCEHFEIVNDRLTLERLIGKPNFRANQIVSVAVDGSEMIRIEFECPFPLETRKDPRDANWHPVQGGYVILDPKHYWCVKEYRVHTQYADSVGDCWAKYEYTEGRDQFPILRRATKKHIARHPDGKDLFTLETDSTYDFRESAGEFDDTEFTLSKYGLPEPVGVTWKKRTPTYVWLLIGAGGVAALSLGLFYLGRRYRKSRPSS